MSFKLLFIILPLFALFFSCSDPEEEQKARSDSNTSNLFQAQKEEDKDLEQYKENLKTLGFVLVKAGEFEMGSPANEPGRPPQAKDDEKQVEVKITNSFFIGKFEVSNAEWALVWSEPGEDDLPSKPVVEVSYSRAVQFCKEWTRQLKLMDLLPEKMICRLPTEAEWEFACRAGNDGVHGFGGFDTNESDPLEFKKFKNVLKPDDANFLSSTTSRKPSMVYGSDWNEYSFKDYSKNQWDIYHMHGNVREWCYDVYEIDYSDAIDGNTSIDPMGPLKGKYRVLRGGSYNTTWEKCRAAARDFAEPYVGREDIGFRVVIGYPIR